MNIFKHLNYKTIISEALKTRLCTRKQLAKMTGIHSSYFSRVMNHKADFSSEQVFAIGESLELSRDEIDYLMLTLEFSSTANSKHKSYLRQKLEDIRRPHLKLNQDLKNTKSAEVSTLGIQNYYLNPIYMQVHIYLTIPKYQAQPKSIAEKLSIDIDQLNRAIKALLDLGLIMKQGTCLVVSEQSLNLDEDDHFSKANHSQWRAHAINKIHHKPKKMSDYHFSVIFSTDEESKLKLKQLFKEFVTKAQKQVQSSKPTQVLNMNFDLY